MFGLFSKHERKVLLNGVFDVRGDSLARANRIECHVSAHLTRLLEKELQVEARLLNSGSGRIICFRHPIIEHVLGCGGERNQVHVGPVGSFRNTTRHPAVSTPSQIATFSVDEEHPAVEKEANRFNVETVDPANESERQKDDVEDPDEHVGANFAVKAEDQPPEPIDQVVDQNERHDEREHGCSIKHNGLQFEEESYDLEKDDHSVGENRLVHPLRFFTLSTHLLSVCLSNLTY